MRSAEVDHKWISSLRHCRIRKKLNFLQIVHPTFSSVLDTPSKTLSLVSPMSLQQLRLKLPLLHQGKFIILYFSTAKPDLAKHISCKLLLTRFSIILRNYGFASSQLSNSPMNWFLPFRVELLQHFDVDIER